jgi:hypothetical protein
MDLIKAITSDDDLIKLANKIGVKIDAIYDAPDIKSKIPKKGSFIILMRNHDGVGHWVAVHDNFYFDSMGEGPPKRFGIKKYNEVQYQGTYDDYCGIYCLMFLYAKQHNKSDLLKGFNDLNVKVV